MTTRFALRIGPRAEVQQCSIETFVKKRSYLNLSMFFFELFIVMYIYGYTQGEVAIRRFPSPFEAQEVLARLHASGRT